MTALHLEALPKPQRMLWDELDALPSSFVLYGGTGIALQLGHRVSVDFDFFSTSPLNETYPDLSLPFLKGCEITHRAPNTLSCIVDRSGPVKVSFFGVPKLPRILPPVIAKDNRLHIASLLDLAGTKAMVVQMRAEAKDYLDLDAIIRDGRIDLGTALASAGTLYGTQFSPQITLKAMSYFEDSALTALPNDVKHRLITAVRDVDLDQLPKLDDPIYNPGP